MKGPGAYGQLLNQQTANSQRNEQMQAQRQLGQQQQQRQQNGVAGQDGLALQPNQQQALFRQLQNMQQQQQQMAQNGNGLDQNQIPATPVQSNMTATPRPMSLSVNGQHGGLQPGGTPNSQATSSPVAMGTPSGSADGRVTAAMAFKKIEDMSDEKRNMFFRNVSREGLQWYDGNLSNEQTPPIRRSYFTYVRALADEQRRELFIRVCPKRLVEKPQLISTHIETGDSGSISRICSGKHAAASQRATGPSVAPQYECHA